MRRLGSFLIHLFNLQPLKQPRKSYWTRHLSESLKWEEIFNCRPKHVIMSLGPFPLTLRAFTQCDNCKNVENSEDWIIKDIYSYCFIIMWSIPIWTSKSFLGSFQNKKHFQNLIQWRQWSCSLSTDFLWYLPAYTCNSRCSMTLVLRRLILKNLNSACRYNFLLLLLIRKRLITEHHTVRVGFPKKWKNCPLLTNPLGPSDEPLMHEINFTLGPIQKSLYLLLLYRFIFAQNRPKSDISIYIYTIHYIKSFCNGIGG